MRGITLPGLLLVLTIAPLPGFGQDDPRILESGHPYLRLTREGRVLGEEEARRLEQGLAENPEDIEARVRLLGYYSKPTPEANTRRAELALWLIEHRPDYAVAGAPVSRMRPEVTGPQYQRARELWLSHVEKPEAGVGILANAARFFSGTEPEIAGDLLMQASRREPKEPGWMSKLAAHEARRARSLEEPARSEALDRALEYAEKASALISDDAQRFFHLPRLAHLAFEAGEYAKAEAYAQRALDGARRLEEEPSSSRNVGEAIHHGHRVLGLLALRSGDVEAAKRHLLDSARTAGSPSLSSFGPNMNLAEALLLKEQKEVVLEYFELCRKFWKMDRGRLDTWTESVKAGATPDFGANLYY